MTAYMHGSLALDDRQSKAAAPARKQQAVAAPASRAKAMPGAEKALWIGLAFFLFSILGIYQYFESAKYEMNANIVKMEAEIRTLEAKNATLKNEIATLGSPERLIEKGIQLGLVEQGAAAASYAGAAVASAE